VESTVAAGGVLNTTVFAGAQLTAARLDQTSLALEGNSKLLLGPHTNASRLTSISIGAGATLDIGTGALVIDYTGASPRATIREKVLSGRGGAGLGATWTGTGITSSAAALINQTAPETRSVGYAENAVLPLGLYPTYKGVPLDETSIIIAYVPTADATLDGLVNDNDVTVVGATYAPELLNPAWALGDFDFNDFVDDDDVTLLGALYERTAPAPAPRDEGRRTNDAGRSTSRGVRFADDGMGPWLAPDMTRESRRATSAWLRLNDLADQAKQTSASPAPDVQDHGVADARLATSRRTRIADAFWANWS
jgi:hypothetical protein